MFNTSLMEQIHESSQNTAPKSPLVNRQGWVSLEQLGFKELPNLHSDVFVGANLNEDMGTPIQRVRRHLIRKINIAYD